VEVDLGLEEGARVEEERPNVPKLPVHILVAEVGIHYSNLKELKETHYILCENFLVSPNCNTYSLGVEEASSEDPVVVVD
jgi:hypothetical protein